MADDLSRVILDTSVWVAFLNTEDSQHTKAQKLMDEMTDQVLVPEYVLVETASVLKNYRRHAEAIEFVKMTLADAATFISSDSLVYETGELFCSRNDGLSFIDTALLVLSETYRVITFDKRLQKEINRA